VLDPIIALGRAVAVVAMGLDPLDSVVDDYDVDVRGDIRGLLTGAMSRERIAALPKTDWRTRNDQFKEPRLSENLKLVERLRGVGARYGRAPGEVPSPGRCVILQ
jgi:hypothetical protein